MKIRKDDTVEVISGRDRGKKGKILKIFPAKDRAVAEGINLVKKHMRRTRQDQEGGIIQKEATISVSNLMIVCKNCSRSTRIGFTVLNDGSKVRSCKKCGEAV